MAEKEFSAGGIVIREEGDVLYILLIKDGYGRWTWPKGKIDKGESPEDAAIREIKEETGISNVQLLKKVGLTQYFYKLKGALIFKTVYVFLCKTRNVELKIQASEIKDAKWYTPKEARETVEYKGSKELLEKAIRNYKALL